MEAPPTGAVAGPFNRTTAVLTSYPIPMSLRTSALLGLATAVAAGLTACSGGDRPQATTPTSPATGTLNGAGATFPASIYERWFEQFTARTGTKVNYQSVGSGAGIKQFITETVDFGATDAPMKDSEIAKVARGVAHLPMTAGAIAVVYNQPGCSLKLTQAQLVDIFLGKISDFKDLGCAPGRINVVRRSDGSGTTFNFTNSLAAFNPAWKTRVGVAKSVQWPTGIGAKGNDGVSETIKRTPGSIGYVELSYAIQQKLSTAAIQNRAGSFITPSAESASAALAAIDLGSDRTQGDPNPAGAESYPIVTYSWVLAYRNGNGAKAAVLRQLFEAMIAPDSQAQASELGYVPLPANVQSQVKSAIAGLK